MRVSPDLWFDVGYLTLEEETARYRVHRDVLQRHSPSFVDILLLYQRQHYTAEDSPSQDGRVIRVDYDRKKDWDHLLGFVYKPLEICTRSPSGQFKPPIDGVMALLRLAQKYQMDEFKIIACERMMHEFPSTFDEWERSRTFYCYTWEAQQTGRLGFLAYDLLSLFQEVTGLQRLLPAVFLWCIWNSEDLFNILNGRLREDGTVSKLSDIHQKKIILGRDRIIEDSRRLLNKCFMDDNKIPTARCTAQGLCASTRTKLFRKYSQVAVGISFKSMFFNPRIKQLRETDEQFCDNCESWLSQDLKRERELFWDHLPSIFGLQPWDTMSLNGS